MRIVKISALALLLSAPLGANLASAADLYAAAPPPKHHCLFLQRTHDCIVNFFAAICHKDHVHQY